MYFLTLSQQTRRKSLIYGVPLGCLLPDSVGIGMPTYALWFIVFDCWIQVDWWLSDGM